jgi:hypothetical protein
MKRDRSITVPGRLLWLAVAGLLLLGCGVKARPQPPRVKPPPPVAGITHRIEGDEVALRWAIPKAKPTGASSIKGFYVYRARTSLSDPVCPGCPLLFKRIGDIVLADMSAELHRQNVAVFFDTLIPGFEHAYKVVVYNQVGMTSPDSEFVQFEH